jgi:predicted TIM-barrel fold metal-dependent hydrolase
MTAVVDSDQHLYEPRSMWLDHIDPGMRDDALRLVDDQQGFTWLTWRGEQLELADAHRPGDTESCGRHRQVLRRGERSDYDYDESVPDRYWSPSARVEWLDRVGLDAAVCFPNFGLLWERRLSGSLPALTANMSAWNRWCRVIIEESGGRLYPVAHMTLRDPDWLRKELRELSDAGVRVAMIAPAPVDGRPLSDPEHDSIWSAFVDHDITPVFHVADQPRVFDDCWYTNEEGLPVIEAVFLWVPPALAVSDLILNGVFERHPSLRVGIVELSSIWVPQFLLMIDGANDFTAKLNGKSLVELPMRPSEYFLERVRVSSFAYEDPRRLTARGGDVFMLCSDFPHSEGTADPLAEYERAGCTASEYDGLFHANIESLIS